jgi:tellurium resistance protein TerZ
VHTLRKEDGAADLSGVEKMSVGVSWDPTAGASGGVLGFAKRQRGTDLDLIAILVRGTEPVRLAGLDSLNPLQNGAVVHSGDNQTGKGDGDDETVVVDFSKVAGSPVTSIVFVAAAFKKGSSFQKARNISFKVYDATGGSTAQVADIWPSLLGKHNVNAVAKTTLRNGAWQLEVLDEPGNVKQGDEQSLLNFAIGK